MPDGLSGNDDCGQMSAWYIFSALGFYPMCPGSDRYELGAPVVERASIPLPDGKTFYGGDHEGSRCKTCLCATHAS
jgi:putative alpha-1,2-mannosidase